MTPFALCQTLCSMQVSAQLLHSDLFGACSLCNVLTSSTSPQVLCIARALKCDRAHAPQVYSEAAAGAASAGAVDAAFEALQAEVALPDLALLLLPTADSQGARRTTSRSSAIAHVHFVLISCPSGQPRCAAKRARRLYTAWVRINR